MAWKRVLAIWQRVENRIESLPTKFDRVDDARTTPVEIVSTEGWSDEDKRAWLERARRAHDLRRRDRQRRPSG